MRPRTRLVFGMAADGRAFPEHPGGPHGALDDAVVGPSGLLGMLALRLGLGGPAIPPVVRVATWLSKLDAARTFQCFWSASFRAEPWTTATSTLASRDALVEGGWKAGTNMVGGRPADLAAAELIGPPLPPARGDLLRGVIEAVRAGEPTDLDRVDLLEPIATLPPAWGDLMIALGDAGVSVSCLPIRPAGTGDHDLARLQRFLQNGDGEALVGDGSVTIVEAPTSLMAAEILSEALAANASGLAGTVVVVPGRDGALLDACLRGRGAPTLGMSTPSPSRAPFPLLPATFAAAWRPFDPGAMLRLLQLPFGPLPDWVARPLAAALAREPGPGVAWAEAWAEISVEAANRSNGKSAGTVSAQLERWRAWAGVGRFDREVGIPVPEAIAICRRIRDWAVEAEMGMRAPLFLGCAAATSSLAAAFVATGRATLSARLIESMIAAALDRGQADPSSFPEASLARAVSHPGAVWGEVKTLAWWNCSRRPGGCQASTWTAAERESLAAAGCRLDGAAAEAEREAGHWRRAIANVTDRLVLVTSRSDRGNEPTLHPLAELASRHLGHATVKANAETLLTGAHLTVAGKLTSRRIGSVREPPASETRWLVPDGLVSKARGRVESATALEDLLACPLRWLLTHVAGLRRGGDRVLPSIEQLLGNLAHAVAARTFRPGEIPDPSLVFTTAERALPELVDHVAAPLRLPEHAATLAFAAGRIPASLAELARVLSRAGATVLGMEVERERHGELPARGRIDMILTLPSGSKAVVDLKWAGSAARRRREIADGRSVQLAAYGHLVDAPDAPQAGYYLLRQRKLLAGRGTVFATEDVPAKLPLGETWKAIEADHALHARNLSEGSVVALGMAGVEGTLPEGLGFPPDGTACTFCPMRTICRVREEDRR